MIEIIIVFALIGILGAAMIAGNFIPTLNRSRDTKRKSDLAQIARALETYVNDHETYPDSSGAAAYQILGCGVGSNQPCSWGSAFVDENGTVYISRLPEDARSPGREYVYVASSGGTAWQLYARLENGNDPVLDRDGDDVYTAADDYLFPCGSVGNCNYGISSSNVTMTIDLSTY